ncbi:hypothetical protein C8Q80DRAFT_1127689 [Daedaleopsis nitida]|nr:hypothetical protein C8Q80DRAFT_1127689 [Daedaleopsis nitida]
MDSTPPAKRPRTEDTSEGQDEIRKDEQLWFEDGNIVIIAQHSAFCVHKGVLSRHSETFSGLFTVPQPAEDSIERMDGCPVVHVSDSAHDFKHLLHVLYDGGLNFLEPKQSIQFSRLAALVRLAHKYELTKILEGSLARLKLIFTTELQTWLGHGATALRSVHISDDELSQSSTRNPEAALMTSPIEAVNLFRTIDRPEMLPVALYLCTLLPNRLLVHGKLRADGTRLEQLSTADLQCCLDARDELTNLSIEFFYSKFAQDPAPTCGGANGSFKCEHTFTRRRAFLHRSQTIKGFTEGDGVLCGSAQRYIDKMRGSGKLCPACIECLVTCAEKFQREVWAGLPKMLDLSLGDQWPLT